MDLVEGDRTSRALGRAQRVEGRMIRNHLRQLLAREPFEPFRIRLLSDLYHDVF